MAEQSVQDDQPRRRIELPLLLFALVALLAVVLPTRERALLPFGEGTGFLARSAAGELVQDPFGDGLDDPVRRIGVAAIDRSARYLNPVLRSGGAAPTRSRSIDRIDEANAVPAGDELPVGNDAAAMPDPVTIASNIPGNATTGGDVPPGSGSGSTPPSGNPLPPRGGGFIPFVPATPAVPTVPGGVLNPVPEPATWMLMILGFGLIGYGARKRNARMASAE